ncbi:MAG: NAD-dependent epimerase/dehydratase family protein [Gammaproteobacteria bacterium]|nr:NAD-dependent epimerase/dehydratase family protein [Gammaproteobacteria bacterium]
MSLSRSDAKPLAAVTGATGFIGRHVVAALLEAGYRVRALVRSEPADPRWQELRLEMVPGDLGDRAALSRLVDGAQVVIHLAGLIKAPSRALFFAANRDGTGALAAAVREHAAHAHFLLISSLAARQPRLSDYAASKRAGEDQALAMLGPQVTVLRPPAVYGPGDRETLVFFQLARHRVVPIPAPASARAAAIHVGDLARAIATLAGTSPSGIVAAIADASAQGYSWREILLAAARAVGNPAPKLVRLPAAVLKGIAAAGDAACRFGKINMLTSQKLRELRHPDWTVSEAERITPAGWQARYDLDSGFADAVAWYRKAGWLPPAPTC